MISNNWNESAGMKTIKTVMNGDVNDCGVFYKKAVVCWVCANFLIHLLHRFLSKC